MSGTSDTSSVEIEKLSGDGSTKYNVAEMNPTIDSNAITYRELKKWKKHQEELDGILQSE